jgi:hypothetical protein
MGRHPQTFTEAASQDPRNEGRRTAPSLGFLTQPETPLRPTPTRLQQTAASVRLEMISPLFFTLNATNGAIGTPLVCHTIIHNANRKRATQISENTYAFNLLASGPAPDQLQTITREVCPANSHGMFQEAHERFCRI